MNFSVKNKIFFLLIVVMIIAVTIVGWYGFISARNSYIHSTLKLEAKQTKSLATNIEMFLDSVPNDLRYNANFYALQKLIVWEKLRDKRKIRYWKSIYIATLKDYIKNQKLYYKIRVIDVKGKEKVVLRYNNKTGGVIDVKSNRLQNKSKRDYFIASISLQKDEFYISEMNLNMEYGEVEKPFVPVIRYIAPIINQNGNKQGIVILSVNADKILNILKSAKIMPKSEKKYYLLDKDGEYLYAKDSAKEWSNQLHTGYNFNKDYKGILQKCKEKQSVTFMDNNRLYSITKVYPNKKMMSEQYWYVVSVVPKSEALSALHSFTQTFFILLFSVLIIGFFIISTYLSKIINPLSMVTKQLKALAKGEIQREVIEYKSKDEIGQIVNSSSILIDAIETTIIQANAIAGGDFSKDVTMLSSRDALGEALIKMKKRLQEITNLATLLSQGNYEQRLHTMGSDDRVGIALINMINYLKEITQITESIAKGDLDVNYKLKSADDRLGSAVLEMLSYLKSILKQANAISREDFSNNIEVKSKDDDLGIALVKMTDILRKNSIRSADELYLSDGLGSFNEGISAINDIMELSKKAITQACRYVGASSGVVYIFDKEKKTLNMSASFAYVERDELSNSFKLGEGVVGQVALEKEPILLKNIKESEFEIHSGTTHAKAKEVFTFPLMHDGELYGVAEVMSFEQLSDIHKDYLLKIASVLATSLQTVSQNGQIQELLEKSQQAYEELQTQSEELQESNVQMEEQQQQLETQSKELQSKNEILEQAKKEIDKRAEELEKASKYKSEFLANMSHELRTPLNSIILLSKLIAQNQHKTLTKDDIEKALVINKAGNDLLLLINDILDLSKVESGNMELLLESVSSSEVLQELQGLFSALADEKGIKFIVHDNFNDRFVTDKVKLAQVMKNLLSNAFKFTKKGAVTIEVHQEKSEIIFRVTDTGIGIPADKLETIFDAFKQVDGSISREYGGTGLGLSISKTIVDLLGGSLDVESRLGEGTSFVVRLPLKEEAKVKEVVKTAQTTKQVPSNLLLEDEEEATFDSNELNQKNILIVDDDSRNIFTLTSVLESMNAEVYSAFNGQEAIDTLEDGEPIDLILMDIMMPIMNGLESIKKIKSNPKFKDIPIIAVTAKTMPEDKQACLDAGADDYLTKPLDTSALLVALKAWL